MIPAWMAPAKLMLDEEHRNEAQGLAEQYREILDDFWPCFTSYQDPIAEREKLYRHARTVGLSVSIARDMSFMVAGIVATKKVGYDRDDITVDIRHNPDTGKEDVCFFVRSSIRDLIGPWPVSDDEESTAR